MSQTHADTATLGAIRRMLLATLLAGVLGMGSELLLIGHVDGALQLIPVCLLAGGPFVLGWMLLSPSRASVRAVRAVMTLYVASGLLGLILHYRGNAEFELEMYPDARGLELVGKTLTGATPVLAPGSMALLGLVGLVLTFGHPAADRSADHRLKEVTS